MPRKPNKYTKTKIVEVTSNSLFGGPSQMEKEINKWSLEGWELVEKENTGKNKYLLTFEYELSLGEIAALKKRERNRTVAIFVGLAILGVLVFTSGNRGASSSRIATATIYLPTAANTSASVASTQQAFQRIAATNSRATANARAILTASTTTPTREIVASNTLTPSNTPTASSTPSSTPTPTSTSSATPSVTPVMGSVTGDSINARECPNVSCSLVRVVGSLEEFVVLGADGDWYLVQFENGEAAYIRSDLLTVPEDAVIAMAPSITPSPMPTSTRRPPVATQPRATVTSELMSQRDTRDSTELAEILSIILPTRDIRSVLVVDGRRNGGERTAIVSYVTTETSEIGYAVEVLEIFATIGGSVIVADIDLDTVTVLVGNRADNPIAGLVAPISLVEEYARGDIDHFEFFDLLDITYF